ncbi:phage head-tail joining protein [Roseobacter sp. A03A-229]
MALTVDQLVAARDALLDARVQGVRRFRDQNGEEVEYKSDAQMAAALVALDREIAQATGRAIPTTLRFRTSKGT